MKRILSLMLCLAFALVLLPARPAKAMATSVLIAGQTLSNATKCYKNDGMVASDATIMLDWNAYFENGTLTLNNLNITSAANKDWGQVYDPLPPLFRYAIAAEGDLTLHLLGSSQMTASDTDIAAAGDSSRVVAALLVRGGTLTVTGRGSLKAQAGTAVQAARSEGVRVEGNILMQGGTLEGIGGGTNDDNGKGISSGVYAQNGSIQVTGGTLKGAGAGYTVSGNLKERRSFGIYSAFGSIAVSGSGTLAGTGGAVSVLSGSGAISYGVGATNSVTVESGGTLTATGGTVVGNYTNKQSYVVYVQNGSIQATGGALSALTNASSGAQTACCALYEPLTYDPAVIMPKADSINNNGSTSVGYVAQDNSGYLWVKTYPAARVAVSPSASFPVGQAGGPLAFTVGANLGFTAAANFDSATMDAPSNFIDLGSAGSAGVDGRVDAPFTITLYESYLNTLSVGTHTLTIILMGGVDSAYNSMPVRTVITVAALPVPAPASGAASSARGMADAYSIYAGGFSPSGVLTVQADCKKLVLVSVDDVQLVQNRDYTVVCGSTVITFTPAYLASLKDGAHTVRVQFADGWYTGSFTTPFAGALSAVPNVPATGDAPFYLRWLGLQ